MDDDLVVYEDRGERFERALTAQEVRELSDKGVLPARLRLRELLLDDLQNAHDQEGGVRFGTPADTIAQQIGRKALTMIGAHDLMSRPDGLQFSVGSNQRRVTKIAIVLDPSDTYTVKTYTGRGLKLRELASTSDVYADGLHRTIDRMTGMYTSL